MKSLPVLTALASLALVCAAPQTAHAQLKVATVNLAKVFDSYNKAKDAAQRLKEAEKKAQDEVNARAESLSAVQEVIRKLDAERKSSTATPEARAEKDRLYSEKVAEARNLEREIADFRDTRRRQLEQQAVRMRGGIVEEILKAVTDRVRADGYDLVFDTSGRTMSGIPTVVFAKESYDISDEIIALLNKGGGN